MSLSLYTSLPYADPSMASLVLICPRCGSHREALSGVSHGEQKTASGPLSLMVRLSFVCFDCQHGWFLTLWNEAGSGAVPAMVEAEPLEDCPGSWTPMDRLYPNDCTFLAPEDTH